jgi:hypothetical protein
VLVGVRYAIVMFVNVRVIRIVVVVVVVVHVTRAT